MRSELPSKAKKYKEASVKDVRTMASIFHPEQINTLIPEYDLEKDYGIYKRMHHVSCNSHLILLKVQHW